MPVASALSGELKGESRSIVRPEAVVPFDPVAARSLAAELFTSSSPLWQQAQASARWAEQVAAVVEPEDRTLLISAAWLHDIGYSAAALTTGFHPLDGAALLAGRGWPARLVALVAHHCEARITAAALGLEESLLAYPREEGPLTDALVYADLAAGLDGCRMSLRDRLADLDDRHAGGPQSLRDAWPQRRAALIAAVSRTEQRMAGLRRHRPRASA